MTKSVIENIKKLYKKVNICLVGYNAASEYPQTFSNLNSHEKLYESNRIKRNF